MVCSLANIAFARANKQILSNLIRLGRANAAHTPCFSNWDVYVCRRTGRLDCPAMATVNSLNYRVLPRHNKHLDK